MALRLQGAIDCDVHPSVPGVRALFPYLDDYWRDQIGNRHIDKLPFQLSSYPSTSPLSARPDWRPAPGQALGPTPGGGTLRPYSAALVFGCPVCAFDALAGATVYDGARLAFLPNLPLLLVRRSRDLLAPELPCIPSSFLSSPLPLFSC